MPPRTRLDPVVDLRERARRKAELVLASAQRELERRQQELTAARLYASQDHRSTGAVAEWQLVEAGHTRALQLVRSGEERVRTAVKGEVVARVQMTKVEQQLEVVRRAADRKRTELVSAAGKAEAKQLDALASLLYSAR